MPKKKTKKSVAKRVKLTARGKPKFPRPGRGHLLSSKSSKRKRHLRRAKVIHPSYAKQLRDQLV